MTENIPPGPPAHRPQSYPSHAPSGVVPEPYYGPPQPPTQKAPPGYGQPPYLQQPQYAQYPPQYYAPVAYSGLPRAKSSGYRVSSGIIAIVLAVWELLFFANSAYMATTTEYGAYVTTAVVLGVLGLGSLATGIVLLVQHRRRNRITPVALLALSASAILAAVIMLLGELYGAPFLIASILLGLPIIIVLGIGLSKEMRGLV